ncbi:MAG: helix-turn-helix transcriptional regulator [Candidatus Omnitrophota bacterium]
MSNKPNNKFARRLKEARTEKGLSLEELAKANGTTKATLSKYENAKCEPKMMKAKKLADYLGVSFDWLIGDSDEKWSTVTKGELEALFSGLSEKDQKEALKYLQYLKLTSEMEDQKSATLNQEEA